MLCHRTQSVQVYLEKLFKFGYRVSCILVVISAKLKLITSTEPPEVIFDVFLWNYCQKYDKSSLNHVAIIPYKVFHEKRDSNNFSPN